MSFAPRPEESVPDAGLDHRAGPPAGGHGTQKRGSKDSALGRSRGGLSTKIHLLADEDGLPLTFRITGGQAGEYAPAAELLHGQKAEAVLADRDYDSDAIVAQSRDLGASAVIPPKRNRKQARVYDRDLYKQRNRIERCFNKLKHFRRFATRYCKTIQAFRSFTALACAWLFDFPQIGALHPQEAELAIIKPAHEKGADYIPAAADEIVEQTRGYPYFLQEWGKHFWDLAKVSPITLEDVKAASTEAIAALDESFFRVRFDRLMPKEKHYLRAMAEPGPGPHRSGDIAIILKKPTNSLGPLRASLINKGMIWSPNHGHTAFTVPLFDEFMKRIMPGNDW